MSDYSEATIEAIKTAIEMEKEGYEFYTSCAVKTSNELGQKMFESIAKDEQGHLETFQKIFDAVIGSSDWQEVVKGESRVGKSPFFNEDLQKACEANPNELDALRTAMNSERQAIEHYTKLAESTDDPKGKEIFTKIKKEEEYHYDLLQAQYDYLNRTGYYYDIAEFRMDGMY
ncbi:ferritin family protein [bacterium]|nr:ferritin family protein [bacterium]